MAGRWTEALDALRRRIDELAERLRQGLGPRPVPVPVDRGGRRPPRRPPS